MALRRGWVGTLVRSVYEIEILLFVQHADDEPGMIR